MWQYLSGGVQCTVCGEGQCLLGLPAVNHVPDTDRLVPGGTGQDGLDRTETQAANRPRMARQHLTTGTCTVREPHGHNMGLYGESQYALLPP